MTKPGNVDLVAVGIAVGQIANRKKRGAPRLDEMMQRLRPLEIEGEIDGMRTVDICTKLEKSWLKSPPENWPKGHALPRDIVVRALKMLGWYLQNRRWHRD